MPLDQVLAQINKYDKKYDFIIQYTTKGGEMEVINEGLLELKKALIKLPSILTDSIRVEIITEKINDPTHLLPELKETLSIKFFKVPQTYQTKNHTKVKARALHYMVDLRKDTYDNDKLSNTYIIHFDAESVIDQVGLLSIISCVYSNPSKFILQGPIFYPIRWFAANILSRQMESLRPWNCHECYTNTENGYPFHLHGSNIVVRADIENNIGWDYGQVKSYPVVAEDLFFGIKAYLLYGSNIFGWHGGLLKERPAFQVVDSLEQRIRWIRGSLQALEIVPTWRIYQNASLKSRFGFKSKMYFKLLFYAFGFIPALVAFFSLVYVLWIGVDGLFHSIDMGYSTGVATQVLNETLMPMVPHWMLNLSLFGAFLWLFTIQIGLYHNLKTQQINPIKRIVEHIKILLITPLATVLDNGIVFITTIAWIFGYKKADWRVTPKQPTISQ
jgi:hypothetical protein